MTKPASKPVIIPPDEAIPLPFDIDGTDAAGPRQAPLFSDDTLDTAFGWDKGDKKSGAIITPSKFAPRCYETHPPLILREGIKIYGGSCSSPIVTDADVYVGLETGMRRTIRAYPWEKGDEFTFAIRDYCAPDDPKGFVKLIEWLAVQLIANRKVHVGCIGGHGRTGTVLAALAKVMLGENDAIAYVRKNYCKKAVESQAQIDFLAKLFGITKVAPAKEPYVGKTFTGTGTGTSGGKLASWGGITTTGTTKGHSTGYSGSGAPSYSGSKVSGSYRPVQYPHCIWGATACPNKQ